MEGVRPRNGRGPHVTMCTLDLAKVYRKRRRREFRSLVETRHGGGCHFENEAISFSLFHVEVIGPLLGGISLQETTPFTNGTARCTLDASC